MNLGRLQSNALKAAVFRTAMILGFGLAVTGCSKGKDAPAVGGNPAPSVETFPISNSKLVNCHFTNPTPTYAFNSTIQPNVIQCDEGVPKRVELLSRTPLPNGLELDAEHLSLVGTAKEKVARASYTVYLENEAGYVRILLTLTVK